MAIPQGLNEFVCSTVCVRATHLSAAEEPWLDHGMGKQIKLTDRPLRAAEMVAGYRASGKTRSEYCREAGIKVSTLDYYHGRVRAQERLVPVNVIADQSACGVENVRTVAVWLRNGRRLEMNWHGDESSLGRLVGLLERE
jgi:hypothetical protein